MKTPKEWQDIWWSEQHDRRDFIRQIQDDALAEAERICREYVTNGSTVSVSRDCANLIKQKRVAAMPNEKS